MDKKSAPGDIDHVLDDIVGAAGPWQLRFLLLMLSVFGASSLLVFLHLFAAYVPPHRCRVPVCDHQDGNLQIEAQWTDFAIPKYYMSSQLLADGYPHDPCHVNPVIHADGPCNASNFVETNYPALDKCVHGYVYDDGVFSETITSKFDLVCDDKYKEQFLSTLMMLGLLVGSAMGGWLGDYFGRRKALLVACLTMGPSTLLGSLSPNYYVYAVLRLLGCATLPIVWVCGIAILVEVFTAQHRVYVTCLKDMWWSVANVLLAGLALGSRHWIDLHLAVGFICSMAIIAWCYLPESYRWLVENKRKDEAFSIFTQIAEGNQRKLTEEDASKIMDILDQIEHNSVKLQEQGRLSFMDMFAKGHFSTSVILIFTWVTVNVNSYTLSLNATKLSGDVFINFVLSALSELPAPIILVVTLSRARYNSVVISINYLIPYIYFFRRVPNLAILMWTSGISCLALAFIPKSQNTVVLSVYLLAKCAAGAGFNLTWLITSEIYPTNLRSQALGLCSTIGKQRCLVKSLLLIYLQYNTFKHLF